MADKNLHNGIKEARINKNMTEVDLANCINVDVSIITSWEKGKGIIVLSALKKLKKYLNVSYEMLLYDEKRLPLKISHLKKEQQEYIITLHNRMRNK